MKTLPTHQFNPQCLYQDDDLIIINKPSGLLSIPDGYDPSLPHLKVVLEPLFGKLWIVHRLDKETSGIMILARNKETHRKLNERFRTRKIEKSYHALISPRPSWGKLHITLPLRTDADRRHRTRVDHSAGKHAETICVVKKSSHNNALLEIWILTGLTHQIRAHLRAYDLIIIGEQLYNAGLKIPPFPVQRLMLHARSIGFSHPANGDRVEFTAPYPEDFRTALTNLVISTSRDVRL